MDKTKPRLKVEITKDVHGFSTHEPIMFNEITASDGFGVHNGNKLFTVEVKGSYLVTYSVGIPIESGADVYLFVNGSEVEKSTSGAIDRFKSNFTIDFNKGDYLALCTKNHTEKIKTESGMLSIILLTANDFSI